ncbi:MAG: DUF2784 domain-containing protein [Porticoccus sp.]|nr:DUF2784 domain-containing protein [Porticoccus sp.]
MFSSLLADIALILHLAFIVFVVFGSLFVFHRRWIAWIHIPMVFWASVVNLMHWYCPLTPIEKYFREAAGQAGYEGGFIAHYIVPLIYPQGMSYDLGIAIGVSVFIWNGLVYSLVVYRAYHTK